MRGLVASPGKKELQKRTEVEVIGSREEPRLRPDCYCATRET
jgi:hypothetical protein